MQTDIEKVTDSLRRDIINSVSNNKVSCEQGRDKLKTEIITRVYSDDYMESVFKKIRHRV